MSSFVNSIEKHQLLSKNTKKKRRKKYIPGLAAFKFEPRGKWSKEEAKRLYDEATCPFPFKWDTVSFQDCIYGLEKIPDSSVDLIIADPPFGIDFSGKEGIYNRESTFVVDDYQEVKGDYYNFSYKWISKLPRIMKERSSVYIFSGWTNLEYILTAARHAGLTLLNHIIWKYNFGVFTRKKFVTSHYHILLYVKNPEKYYFHKIEHYPEDVWEIDRKYKRGKEKNGTTLPIEVVQRCIDFNTKPGDVILDPFMGNGTTAVAAKGSFRHFYGFEINEKLKPIIDQNISNMKTGSLFIPYKERLPSPEELKEKYPKAYKVYIEELKEKKIKGKI